jgi:hypothetical protein
VLLAEEVEKAAGTSEHVAVATPPTTETGRAPQPDIATLVSVKETVPVIVPAIAVLLT